VNFSILPGETAQLDGPSGVGKTTLFEIITGLLPEARGAVRVDGKILCATDDWQAWRAQVACLPQDPFLFDATIKENLSWFQSDAEEIDIEGALAVAGANEIVTRLPNGLNTRVGERVRLCPAESGNGFVWRVHFFVSRGSCSSTRRLAPWMKRVLRRCSGAWRNCRLVQRCCTSRIGQGVAVSCTSASSWRMLRCGRCRRRGTRAIRAANRRGGSTHRVWRSKAAMRGVAIGWRWLSHLRTRRCSRSNACSVLSARLFSMSRLHV